MEIPGSPATKYAPPYNPPLHSNSYNLLAPQSGAFSRLVFRGPSIHPFQPNLIQSTYSFERSKLLHGALKQTKAVKVDHGRPKQSHLNI